ncbi:MAG: PIN domain-containing protein [Anaerolineae bacterium]|nr:PIN domain-containing protein [Anaerolineae bacterium]
MAKVLIDTNVLVYAYDRADLVKQRRAIDLLGPIRAARMGIISAQTLSEFFSVTTRKLTPSLTLTEAERQLHIFAAQWPVLPVTEKVVLEAVRGARVYQLHFWDAQIWAAARLNGVPLVFSEDCNTDAIIEGVRFINPFASDFTLAKVANERG